MVTIRKVLLALFALIALCGYTMAQEGSEEDFLSSRGIEAEEGTAVIGDDEVTVEGTGATVEVADDGVSIETSDDLFADDDDLFADDDDLFADDDDLFADDDDLFADDEGEDILLGDDPLMTGEEEQVLEGWGYTPAELVTVKESGDVSVTLTTPVILDGIGNQITIYKVIYATQSVATTDPLSLKEQTFEFDEITGSTVDLEVTGLIAGTQYYGVVVPFNNENVEGNNSEEFTFMIEVHQAATVEIGGVSYVAEGNNVSMKWAAVQGADKIEIFTRGEAEKDFVKVGEVPATSTSYNFTVMKAGNYFAKMIPVDASGTPVGPEVIQSVKVDEIVEVQPETIPQVGPETNLIIAGIMLAMIGYVLIRARRMTK